ncbi:MAG TPA: VWA domain-containing protein [Steroidobacteraceae bacterium]|nr:VWA domain-containing protein [Steroidobacteraceae bacterium]
MSRLRGLFQAWDRGSIAIALVAAILVLGLALPTVPLQRSVFDYIVVLDISQSMNVEDYELDGAQVSRLDFARDAARRALRSLPCGSRVGWGAFTGGRTLLLLAPVEVCSSYNDLLASLAQIDGRMRWAEASEVAKGLYWAIEAAQSTASKPNLLFVSDGQEAPPLEFAELPGLLDKIKDHSIRGWLVGAGGEEPSPIPKVDPDGTRHGFWRPDEVLQSEAAIDGATPGLEHFSSVREEHLQRLARDLHLDYTRLTGLGSLSDAMRDRRFARQRQVPTDLSWVAAALALLVLVLRFRPTLPGKFIAA